jgi:hypothetical protein
MAFKVPNGWEQYHHQIKKCVDALLDKNIISGLSPTKLSSWYGNFETQEELYLAAHLLDSLVYRTEKMLEATAQHILDKMIPCILTENGFDVGSVQDFRESLKNFEPNLPIRFSTVTSTSPGKSGDSLLRLFCRSSNVDSRYNVYVKDLNKKDRTNFVFILDDIVGTGKQFSDFARENGISSESEDHNFYFYIPFMAHDKGLKKIRNSCPKIAVCPVEVLSSNKHNFFRPTEDGGSIWARDGYNKVQDVKAFYRDLVTKNGIESGSIFGFGKLGLTVYTEISCPNNSLSVFYSNRSPDWVPLFNR